VLLHWYIKNGTEVHYAAKPNVVLVLVARAELQMDWHNLAEYEHIVVPSIPLSVRIQTGPKMDIKKLRFPCITLSNNMKCLCLTC